MQDSTPQAAEQETLDGLKEELDAAIERQLPNMCHTNFCVQKVGDTYTICSCTQASESDTCTDRYYQRDTWHLGHVDDTAWASNEFEGDLLEVEEFQDAFKADFGDRLVNLWNQELAPEDEECGIRAQCEMCGFHYVKTSRTHLYCSPKCVKLAREQGLGGH